MADVKPVILIVDDELSIRESFLLILGKEFKVVTAASGEAALKRIIDEKVDLVYLDIRMPGMNGIETLKRIKEIDGGIEVIMVTAVNDVGKARGKRLCRQAVRRRGHPQQDKEHGNKSADKVH
jgi:CheY-like chemotaxis protein